MGIKPMNIIIVGGSLGGLFTGIILKRLGHTVKILERAPTALLQNQGAGIVAGGSVQEFFAKHDRTKTPIAVTSHVRQYLNKNGEIIHSQNQPQKMTSWDLLYNILRSNFDGMSSDYCPIAPSNPKDGTGEYIYGHTVTSIIHSQETSASASISPTPQNQDQPQITISYANSSGEEGTMNADLLIGADGPSSTIRKMLLPKTERTYAGYVAWRGTVPETELSPETLSCFAEKFTFFHGPGIQILAYLIPGLNGSLHPSSRLLNYVWYTNHPETNTSNTSIPTKTSLKTLLTDTTGKTHTCTLPPTKMSPKIWTNQKAYARETVPPQFAELVEKTKEPFVQVITDVLPDKAIFDISSGFSGEEEGMGRVVVILVGDAVAGFRPHTAGSTGQAAWHALGLEEVFRSSSEGNRERDLKERLAEWEESVLEWGRVRGREGIEMGERSQFGRHPLGDGI